VYEAIKRATLLLLKVPPEPEDPFGHRGTLRVFRAAPAFWKYRLFGWALGHGAALAAGLLFFGAGHVAAFSARSGAAGHGVLFALEALGLMVAAVELPISYAALRLDYEMRWYKVTDRSLRIREGVLLVREQTMTFANVQNVALVQGPLERFFGFANLEVRSAGGGGHGAGPEEHGAPRLDMHRAVFRGLEDAAEIRDLVMERLRQARDGGLGDPDDAGDGTASSPGPATAGRPTLLASLRDEASALRRVAEALAGPH
jgi:membrane protein YdbS with pleckstrin-like domain